MYGPDISARNDLVVTTDTTLVNLGYIREEQNKYRKSRPRTMKVGAGNVWRAPDKQLSVPL